MKGYEKKVEEKKMDDLVEEWRKELEGQTAVLLW